MLSGIASFFRDYVFTTKDDSYTFKLMYQAYLTPIGAFIHRRSLNRARKELPRGHRRETTGCHAGLFVSVLPVAYDNYCYIVRRTADSTNCVVVDCGDAVPVLALCEKEGWNVAAVLTTHKHWDHCYGNSALKQTFPDAIFVGGRIDRPSECSTLVSDLEAFCFAGLSIRCHEVFGHTHGHVIYEIRASTDPPSPEPPLLFTGDTIFVGGVGKTFEGTNEQMIRSLDLFSQRFTLEAAIFPGHEYAWDNLGLARYLDPHSEPVEKALQRVQTQRIQRVPSVPTLLREELAHNPFLRTSLLTGGGTVAKRAEKLQELRKLKEAYADNREEFDLQATHRQESENYRRESTLKADTAREAEVGMVAASQGVKESSAALTESVGEAVEEELTNTSAEKEKERESGGDGEPIPAPEEDSMHSSLAAPQESVIDQHEDEISQISNARTKTSDDEQENQSKGKVGYAEKNALTANREEVVNEEKVEVHVEANKHDSNAVIVVGSVVESAKAEL